MLIAADRPAVLLRDRAVAPSTCRASSPQNQLSTMNDRVSDRIAAVDRACSSACRRAFAQPADVSCTVTCARARSRSPGGRRGRSSSRSGRAGTASRSAVRVDVVHDEDVVLGRERHVHGVVALELEVAAASPARRAELDRRCTCRARAVVRRRRRRRRPGSRLLGSISAVPSSRVPGHAHRRAVHRDLRRALEAVGGGRVAPAARCSSAAASAARRAAFQVPT